MKLELHRITISKLVFGAQTGVSGGVLTVNKDELTALLMQDERLGGVEIDAAHPGEHTRIMPVKENAAHGYQRDMVFCEAYWAEDYTEWVGSTGA